VAWARLPDREEAGSPNVVGAVALAAAIQELQEIGLDTIAAHEADLTRYATARLGQVRASRSTGRSTAGARPKWE
jgi:cysteine desulfurase/selenocysteine lyase